VSVHSPRGPFGRGRPGSLPFRVYSGRRVAPSSTVTGMSNIGDGPFQQGEHVWVIQADGSRRAAEYVGVGEMSAWFGGPPQVLVVYPDTKSGEAVEVDRVIPRHG